MTSRLALHAPPTPRHRPALVPPMGGDRCQACGGEMIAAGVLCAGCAEMGAVGLRLAAREFGRMSPAQRRAVIAAYPVSDDGCEPF